VTLNSFSKSVDSKKRNFGEPKLVVAWKNKLKPFCVLSRLIQNGFGSRLSASLHCDIRSAKRTMFFGFLSIKLQIRRIASTVGLVRGCRTVSIDSTKKPDAKSAEKHISEIAFVP